MQSIIIRADFPCNMVRDGDEFIDTAGCLDIPTTQIVEECLQQGP